MPSQNDASPSEEATSTFAHPIVALGVAAVVIVGVVARFVTLSPLWLDEALSVYVADVGVGGLADALRRDGHPPLYYALLSMWTSLVGDGDAAVRSLSGIISLLGLPLAWIAGRRRAGVDGAVAVTVLVAVAPWSIRYATETRMYSLLFVLSLAGWLLADDLLRRPDRRNWLRVAGLSAVTTAGLWTHYWTMYLGLAAVGCLAVRLRTHPDERSATLRVGAAMAVGAVAFLPWLPVFLDQAADTGTPWAGASRPTTAITELTTGLGGGRDFAEGPIFGWFVLVFVLVGLLASASRGHTLTLDLRTAPGVRGEVAVAAATLVVGVTVGYATSSTFVARYAAVFLPMVLIAAGVGVTRLPTRLTRIGALAVLAVIASAGIAKNVLDDRTQGDDIAAAIAETGSSGDVVAFCPDQLGPATIRGLDARVPAGTFAVLGVPLLDDPRRVDWRNYAERNAATDPAAVADALLDRADGGLVFFVVNNSYRTYEGLCEGVFARLVERTGGRQVVADAGADVFEHAALFVFG